ncbi:hypothetical protein HQN89_22170 [Paenibacillus frigoriresistens]|nr:hypothetical protein [Paenibacillus frigoriresistens]
MNEQHIEIQNGVEDIDLFLNKYEDALKVQHGYVICVTIDGVEVFGDFRSRLIHDLESAKNVEIKQISVASLAQETLLSLSDYTGRILHELPVIIDRFYQGGSSSGWTSFSEFLKGMEWILDAMKAVRNSNPSASYQSIITSLIDGLNEKMKLLLESVDSKDSVHIADVLQFEISMFLEEMQQQIDQLRNIGDE